MGNFKNAVRLDESSRTLRLHSPVLRCLLGALSTLPAVGFWVAAMPLSGHIPYLPFFFSVLFSAWFLGYGPGLTATALAALLVQIFIFPDSSFASGTQLLLHSAFIAAGVAMSVMVAARKAAERRLEEMAATLEGRVFERTETLERQIEMLKETEALLRRQAMLIQLTHDAILVRGYHDARIEFWNRGAAQLYGWTEEEALGRNLPDLLKAQYSEPPATIEETLLRSDRWEGEVIHTRKDGRKLTLASRWSLVRDAAGNPASIIQLNADITEKQLAETRARHNERLAALGTAAAVLAHEIANPLNGIASSLQVLEIELGENRALSPELAETLKISMDEIQRLARLLNDFRTLSHPRGLVLKPTHVPELIDEILRAEETTISAAGVLLEREYEDVPAVPVDAEKIKQVMLNLIKNGVEAMPSGGVLRIRCYTVQESLRVEVSDTGPGVPDGIDVFQLFTTTKTGGTGMGLPVAREILIAHRAQLSYNSESSKGTTFTIEFPIGDADAAVVGQAD